MYSDVVQSHRLLCRGFPEFLEPPHRASHSVPVERLFPSSWAAFGPPGEVFQSIPLSSSSPRLHSLYSATRDGPPRLDVDRRF